MNGSASLRVSANAKLNLSLDIVGRRADGYHLMDMVMHSVDLADELELTPLPSGGIKIASNSRFLPCDRRNLVWRAAEALAEAAGREPPNLSIYIRKRIPSQSGLGGGSADAAALLRGLRELWKLDFDDDRLRAIGATIGADVPFCVSGGAARVGGIGEVIEPLPPLGDCWFVIMMPQRGNSTRDIFERFDSAKGYERPDTDRIESELRSGDVAGVGLLLRNVFETSGAAGDCSAARTALLSCGALGASLTGSGAAVFGAFSDCSAARECQQRVRPLCRRCFLARSAQDGGRLL